MIAFDQLVTARLGTRDDTVVFCGGAENRCRDELAYIDTLPNGVRWLFFDPGWHRESPDDELLLDWLRSADPAFQYLQSVIHVWRRSKHVAAHRRVRRRPPTPQALENGGPSAGWARRAQHLPALAVCWDGHVNVLDAKQLRVR